MMAHRIDPTPIVPAWHGLDTPRNGQDAAQRADDLATYGPDVYVARVYGVDDPRNDPFDPPLTPSPLYAAYTGLVWGEVTCCRCGLLTTIDPHLLTPAGYCCDGCSYDAYTEASARGNRWYDGLAMARAERNLLRADRMDPLDPNEWYSRQYRDDDPLPYEHRTGGER